MPGIDVDALLKPVSADLPAGEDLEYDPAFLEIVRLAEGTPERVMGETIIPAEEPNWHQLESACTGILLRSKDLRIALLLLRALIRTASLPGFQSGIQLLIGMLERYWDNLHPGLDAADDNDPTERISVLASLVDPNLMLTPLREATLIRSRVFGELSLRDIELVEGKAKPLPGAAILDAASLHAAFMDCDLDELSSHAHAASAAVESIRTLSALLQTRVQATAVPDFDPLSSMLSAIQTALQARLNERAPAAATADEPQVRSHSEQTGHAAAPAAPVDPMRIASRDDVVRILDALCDYYKRNEPSSPVPLLLSRARRLATMDFLAIVTDLVPEALDKVTLIQGPDDNKPQ
ncbi:MAG TPA: type VI secretion system protein TssA [Chromatiaceae bacterium]|jgi:type VI secretion system protein ImpA|nr:MAG: hypothetical protein N838_02410 [Thiohalocapsa sp. PB-PSB1]QQO54730.1 MAG: type VI secretion system protein TssA [Thiohalocapsa sp. PB-PSB1]HBG94979.1 type VI secretion system protein TssA [Chromatiaceae bacterium]HCS90643.1 type VI secretion system protein TssA [Chromatiaceae bacterium]